ncbi:hypothetical protein M902_0899 [Bacteriovorax sp. BAL6_X]|uniref:hypothetical protein n=1 Tax=Bacteriovorax sp. BAL6_X TaxID=1201290 RepID=UPI0003864059|nr:hypothetical protein [Bacteriovorax sp. BAL6_X]EPZ49980.1 hypothetical protein M902_0899 [Bacteriovorax sp. BAL6_X]
MITAICVSLIGALSTFHLSRFNKIGTIRASAFLTLVAYTILYFTVPDYEMMAVIFFGSSFVGMSCPVKMHNYTIIIGAVFFALFFQYLVPYLEGYGGALGMSAFLSVLVIQLALYFGRKLARSN